VVENVSGGTSKITLAVVMVVIISSAGFFYLFSNPTILSDIVFPVDDYEDDSPIQAIDSPLKIDGNAEMVAAAEEYGFSGSGSNSDPYIIENLSIVSEGNCIDIRNIEASFEIRNCSLGIYNWHYSAIGIYIANCDGASVIGCRTEGGISGVEVFQSDGCRIIDCIAKHSIFGLNFSISESPEVSNCIADNNTMGIVFVGCNYTTLSNNAVIRNWIGITSQWSFDGLMTSNNITANIQGIALQGRSINWTITNNWIAYNIEYGIYLETGANDTLVYANMLGWNEGNNAIDDGWDNKWDLAVNEEGNFWHDHVGTGWYAISGIAESMDHFPGVLE